MTSTEFQSLKCGDRVCIPGGQLGRLIGTEVLAIDRMFRKVTVLLGRKPYSYRYVRSQARVPIERIGPFVWMCQ